MEPSVMQSAITCMFMMALFKVVALQSMMMPFSPVAVLQSLELSIHGSCFAVEGLGGNAHSAGLKRASICSKRRCMVDCS